MIKRIQREICSCIFFSHSQQTGSDSEGGAAVISTVVLCCGSGSEAAQHPPWRVHITADADFVIVQRRSVCHCMFVLSVCVLILYIFHVIQHGVICTGVNHPAFFSPVAAVNIITSSLF